MLTYHLHAACKSPACNAASRVNNIKLPKLRDAVQVGYQPNKIENFGSSIKFSDLTKNFKGRNTKNMSF